MKSIRSLREEIQKLKKKKQKIDYDLVKYYENLYKQWEEEQDNNEHNMEEDDAISFSPDQEMEKELSDINYEIQQLENELLQQEVIIKVSKGENRFRSGIAVSDLKTAEDSLYRKDYAKTIANFITDKNSEKINVGVFGKWGQGKSSFMELIKKHLMDIKENNHRKDLHVVYFNAAEYDNREKIWTQLLRVLFNEYEQEHPFLSKFKYNCILLGKDIKDNSFKYILNIAMFITFFIVTQIKNISFEEMKNFKLSYIKNFKLSDIFILIPSIILIKDSIIPIIKTVFLASNKISSNLLNIIKFPNLDLKLGYKEFIKETYDVLISAWLKKNERIIIFVDELDRLSKEHIMEFFESMQLFIDNKELSFVIAIDYKTVCCAITESNLFQLESIDTTTTQKIMFGMNYIDKYINLPFHLNDEIDHKLYIEKMLGNMLESQSELKENDNNDRECNDTNKDKECNDTNKDKECNDTNKDEKNTFTLSVSEKDTIFTIFDKLEGFNARKIKKILNLIILGKNFHYQSNLLKINEGNKHEITSFEDYTRWFCFSYGNSRISSEIVDFIKKGAYEDNTLVRHLIEHDLKDYKKNKNLKIIETLSIGKIKILNQISKLFIFDDNQIY